MVFFLDCQHLFQLFPLRSEQNWHHAAVYGTVRWLREPSARQGRKCIFFLVGMRMWFDYLTIFFLKWQRTVFSATVEKEHLPSYRTSSFFVSPHQVPGVESIWTSWKMLVLSRSLFVRQPLVLKDGLWLKYVGLVCVYPQLSDRKSYHHCRQRTPFVGADSPDAECCQRLQRTQSVFVCPNREREKPHSSPHVVY